MSMGSFVLQVASAFGYQRQDVIFSDKHKFSKNLSSPLPALVYWL